MKANGFSKWAAAASALMALAVPAMGQQSAAVTAAPVIKTAPQTKIVVSLEDRKLALVEDGKVMRVYTVAIGKPSSPSPVGTFTIERRIKNPVYQHDGKTVQPGPGNPVGTRWMGLNIKGYGIHGTNAPKSIGKAASHGCIRMGKKDVEELFALVQVGDTVELVGQRDAETAQLFGDPQKSVVAQAQEAVITTSTAPVGSVTPVVNPVPVQTAASVTTEAAVEGVAVTGNR
jgi:lipoprotein-anchoring transpeptidase ErfK/SrfK